MNDRKRLEHMRHAIDMMEGALMRWPELVDLPEKWGEPRHRGDIRVLVAGNTAHVYDVCDALAELTRIINSPDYEIGSNP
jgi:hypothetical protein